MINKTIEDSLRTAISVIDARNEQIEQLRKIIELQQQQIELYKNSFSRVKKTMDKYKVKEEHFEEH